MVSRILRRSGVAIVNVAESLGWKPSFVIQVGIGDHHEEVAVMQEAWPGVSFLGFEPHPDIQLDDYPGEVIRKACCRFPGAAKLHYRRNHKNGATLHPYEGFGGEEVGVVTCSLDEYECKIDQYPVLLWLDCEGSEFDVLQGATRVLKNVSAVNIEMTASRKEWVSPLRIHRELTSNGFIRQWIHTQRSSIGQYDAIYVRPYLFRRDLCCDPC